MSFLFRYVVILIFRSEKVSEANPPKADFGVKNPVSGKDWNNYFKDKYGAGNVNWKPSSFEDIIVNPQKL